MAGVDAAAGNALSDTQLAALLRKAGVPAGDAAYLVATAHPESGADPSSVQQGQPYATTGWGLWQITPGNSEPQYGVNQALLNPQKNADAAAAKLKSQGLGAWTTITHDLYRPYFSDAEKAVAKVYKMSGSQVDQLASSAGMGAPSGGGSKAGKSGGSKAGKSGGSSDLSTWVSDLWAGFNAGLSADPGAPTAGAAVAGLPATAQAIVGLTAPFAKIGEAVDFLLQPSHWIRIFCGVGGTVLGLLGIWNLSHVGGQASTVTVAATTVPTSAGGTLALPIGILELGIGGVLLFVAFHNLPATVRTFPDFVSYLQQEIQSAPSKAPVS